MLFWWSLYFVNVKVYYWLEKDWTKQAIYPTRFPNTRTGVNLVAILEQIIYQMHVNVNVLLLLVMRISSLFRCLGNIYNI